MNKAQKSIVIFLTVSILAIAILFLVYIRMDKGDNPNLETTILYYGETCPHCKVVDAFIANNSIETRMNITHKEVSRNATNAAELRKAAENCKLDINTIGVPFLYSDGLYCYVGDRDIIDFLSMKLNSTEIL